MMKAGVFQRLRATERRMLRMICGVMLKDMVESTVIASRVGMDEHLRQKRLRWFGHIASRSEEVGIKKVFELKIEGWRKRGRPVKPWIDMVEEDMKKRGVVQQDAGHREGWRRRAVKGLTNALVGKICQNNKLMMMLLQTDYFNIIQFLLA